MESSSSRLERERKKQDEIRKQIALLQAQLADLPDEDPNRTPAAETCGKRKQERSTANGGVILAPATPSPKKKRKLDTPKDLESLRPIAKTLDFRAQTNRPAPSTSSKPAIASKDLPGKIISPVPSTFLDRLSTLTNEETHVGLEKVPLRSVSFTDAASSNLSDKFNPKRNVDLTIIEDIEPGPYEHKSPLDDPNFERLEPHSGIRLSSRMIPHSDICEYMRGRFYLSPSRLYSCVRISADKQSYDVPVPGDWVTVAVVAEIGEVKYTRPPVALAPDEEELKKFRKKENRERGKGKGKEAPQDEEDNSSKGGGKRYVNIRLVDFGGRSKGSETGGNALIRGDAFLSMLLFESDGFDWLEPGDDEQGRVKKKVKVYKGGSKGAFESMHKLREGDVVALLNPRVLKPFQRNSTATTGTNSSTNVLAVSPESAGAIILLGRARDFGRCNARRKDGKACGSWCDTRVSDVCDWHMQRAVESRRAGRAEFSAGTTGMSTTTAIHKGRRRAEEFDPEKQWGLVPNESSNGGATYVLSGHVISSTQSDVFVGEKMGREAQARAQRKAAGQEVEKALKQLTERDKDGMRSVLRAREAGNVRDKKEGRARKQGLETKKGVDQDKELTVDDGAKTENRGYSLNVIKGIGFDPAALSAASISGGNKKVATDSISNKLDVLAKLQQAKKEKGFSLKPRPGERVRSGVIAPKKGEITDEGKQDRMVDLDDF